MKTNEESLVPRAAAFARAAHEAIGQKRKYSGAPYWTHPAAVAAALEAAGAPPPVVAAGWLHDVVEDTGVAPEAIERVFGPEVARLVSEVTGLATPADGNRADRKAIDRAHYAGASPAGQSIKAADIAHNVGGLGRHDPAFAAVYIPECEEVLAVLRKANPELLGAAWAACANARGENL